MSNVNEEWRDIDGYEGLYKISNLGRVKSVERYVNHPKGGVRIVRERIKNIEFDNNRPRVELSRNGNKKKYLVYRLLAKAFVPNPNNYNEVNHIDENPMNNSLDNLEWCTHRYNINHGTRTSRASMAKWKGVGMYHPENDVLMMVFSSCLEAAKYMQVSSSSISTSCNKKGRLVKGYKFKMI